MYNKVGGGGGGTKDARSGTCVEGRQAVRRIHARLVLWARFTGRKAGGCGGGGL